MGNKEVVNRQLQLEHYLKCFLEILLNDPTSPIYQNIDEDSNRCEFMSPKFNSKSTSCMISGSSSLNSFSSTSSNNYVRSHFDASDDSQNPTYEINLSKEKLCKFFSFFEQTQADYNYLSKIQLTQSYYFDRKNSNSYSLLNN